MQRPVSPSSRSRENGKYSESSSRSAAERNVAPQGRPLERRVLVVRACSLVLTISSDAS